MTGFHGRENKMARVTVIEEQITTRKQKGAMLELMGHVVDLHENGCSFAERGAAFKPNVILTDLLLPGIVGLKAIRGLMTENSDVSLIGVADIESSDSLPLTLGWAKTIGADLLMERPVTSAKLESALDDMLRPSSDG